MKIKKHSIIDLPSPADLPLFDYDINQERLIMKTDFSKKKRVFGNIKWFSFISITLLSCGLYFQYADTPNMWPFIISSILISLIFFSLCIIRIHFIGEDIAIFKRADSTVTLPCGFWRQPVTVPFDEAAPYFGGYPFHLGLRIPGKGKGIVLAAVPNLPGEWAFYVWYMDRNRPLPPGNVFDKYRKADAARLRQEGYPKPKYPMSPKIELQMRDYIQSAYNADQ